MSPLDNQETPHTPPEPKLERTMTADGQFISPDTDINKGLPDIPEALQNRIDASRPGSTILKEWNYWNTAAARIIASALKIARSQPILFILASYGSLAMIRSIMTMRAARRNG